MSKIEHPLTVDSVLPKLCELKDSEGWFLAAGDHEPAWYISKGYTRWRPIDVTGKAIDEALPASEQPTVFATDHVCPPRDDGLAYCTRCKGGEIELYESCADRLAAANAKLQTQVDEQKAKLDYAHGMGLRFVMMKTSDKPEPYLAHVWDEKSDHERMFREWSHSIGWENEVAKLKSERDELAAWKQSALAVEASWSAQRVGRLLKLRLGTAIHSQIESGIELLISRADDYEATLKRIASNLGRGGMRPNNETDPLRIEASDALRKWRGEA